jgi:hypothetical protein
MKTNTNNNIYMNDKLKFDILQLASKYYLTKQIFDNWYNLNEEEQNKYLSENVTILRENFFQTIS